MDHTVLLVTVAPFVQLFLLFLPAHLLARFIAKRMRESRLKRVLFQRL